MAIHGTPPRCKGLGSPQGGVRFNRGNGASERRENLQLVFYYRWSGVAKKGDRRYALPMGTNLGTGEAWLT